MRLRMDDTAMVRLRHPCVPCDDTSSCATSSVLGIFSSASLGLTTLSCQRTFLPLPAVLRLRRGSPSPHMKRVLRASRLWALTPCVRPR